jgi:hypothetical protein
VAAHAALHAPFDEWQRRPIVIKPATHRDSRSHDYRGAVALILAAGIVALASGTAGAFSTEQLRDWGPECRAERDSIIPPTNSQTGIDRPKEQLFDACMANGGHLPGYPPAR